LYRLFRKNRSCAVEEERGGGKRREEMRSGVERESGQEKGGEGRGGGGYCVSTILPLLHGYPQYYPYCMGIHSTTLTCSGVMVDEKEVKPTMSV
jgi:hypothetical protein